MLRILAGMMAILGLLASAGCGEASDDSRGEIRVFAASSLTDLLEAVVDSFDRRVEGAPHVQLHLAGSSLLARQIEHGAGADVFISAHPSWTTYLSERGFLRRPVELPISNRLVLVARMPGPQRIANLERLALADPGHVPAGIYARSALVCEGLWAEVDHRTTATVDVRAALAAVQEGAADAAIVYGSDALFTPRLHVSEPFSESCQPEITYTSGLATSAPPGAELFAAFLSDSLQAPIWEAFGFASRAVHADSVPP